MAMLWVMTKGNRAGNLPPGVQFGDVGAVRTRRGPRPVTVHLHGHPCAYEVRAARTPDGPVLLDLRVVPLEDGDHLPPDLLRAIPIRRLAAAAVQQGVSDNWLPEPDSAEPEELDWSRFRRPERRIGRPAHGPEHYAEVAEAARAARAAGESARRVIAERWTVAEQTADKWMREARRLGLLEHYRRSPGAPTGQGGG